MFNTWCREYIYIYMLLFLLNFLYDIKDPLRALNVTYGVFLAFNEISLLKIDTKILSTYLLTHFQVYLCFLNLFP